MKRLIFLTVIFLLCYGCKKDNSSDYPSNLIGRWSWIITCPGTIRTGCWTPDSLHPAYDIAFTPESIYNVYYNDTLKFSCVFQIFDSVSENVKYTTHIIKFDTDSTDFYSILQDTL